MSLPLLTGTISSTGSVTVSDSGSIANVGDVSVVGLGTLVDGPSRASTGVVQSAVLLTEIVHHQRKWRNWQTR